MPTTDHAEKNSSYYDGIYAAGYNTSGYYPLFELVLDSIKTIPSPNVLEVGCGIGDLGRMIVEAGIEYRGFDFSREGVKCSLRHCPKGNFWVGDAYDADNYLPHNYNVVVALEVLEHLEDLKVLANLPPGVHLFASVPDYNDPAHLRIYQDPQRDIVERFRPFLRIMKIVPVTFTHQVTGRKMTIYIFHAITKTLGNSNRVTLRNLGRSGKSSLTDRAPSRVGRNDPCPCGSGKKYKKCCLQ
jgi:SAM-dependent methyltransferase